MTKYKLHLTLNSALKHNPCQDGLDKFKEYLDKNNIGPDEPVNLLRVLENNGIAHALWALRACLEIDFSCKVSIKISSAASSRAAAYAADAADAAYAAAADAAYAAAYAADAAAADAADASEREKQKQDLLEILEDD